MEGELLGTESVIISFKKFADEKIFLKIVFIVSLYLFGEKYSKEGTLIMRELNGVIAGIESLSKRK